MQVHSAIIIGLILLGTYVTYVLCRGKYYVADRMMSLNGTDQMNVYEYDVLNLTNVVAWQTYYFK